jgi:hypothetical protein
MKTFAEFKIDSRTVKIVETGDKDKPFKWIEVKKEKANDKIIR